MYEFCAGRGAQYPIKFLGPPREGEREWQVTLVRDEFSAYDSVLDAKDLTDVLERLHSHPASRIDDLLPHRCWQPR